MAEKFVILVVDDNANNRLTLAALLSRLADCQVLQADGGEAALRSTVEREIHLILLDVQMPGMDGFETAQHLQMTERTRHIPVVFVTAVFKAQEFVARGYELGAFDYLTKPLDDNLLLSRIRLYRHLHERERNLEATIKLLVASERELQAKAAELRKLNLAVENSPNSIFITDPQGVIEYANPRFVEDTGYTAAEAIGQKPSLLKSGQTPPETYQSLWDAVLAGGIWRGELLNRRKDGGLYWVSAAIAPVCDAAGAVSHLVGLHTDITAKMRSEEALRAAKESAESANRAKSVFLANMSHELRTPLNAVLGFSKLLERDPGMSAESRQRLATINRAGRHLLDLINDVLEISRIEAGRLKVHSCAFDLVGMLREIEDMVRLRAEEKGLELQAAIAVDLPRHVIGDAHHLKQVLINLLGNAVKYTERGRVCLRAAAKGRVVQFEVADTGHGIRADDQQKVFEPFYQTEVGIAKGEGTGLGLAISVQYARAMGGTLSLESEPEVGSVFTLSLPLPSTEAAAEPVRRSLALGLAAGIRPPRILVVDDLEDNRELVSQMLKQVGFAIRTAANGQEAIDSCLSWRPQLVLMDMRMPVLDGFEATRRIRAQPWGAELKIVALTASVFAEDLGSVLAAGCDSLLKKPVEEDQLLQVMVELLGIRYRYGEAATPFEPAQEAAPDLASLPAAVRAELRVAAEALDLSATRQILQTAAATQPQLAARLQSLVTEFRFDRIVALCDAVATQTGPS